MDYCLGDGGGIAVLDELRGNSYGFANEVDGLVVNARSDDNCVAIGSGSNGTVNSLVILWNPQNIGAPSAPT